MEAIIVNYSSESMEALVYMGGTKHMTRLPNMVIMVVR